MCELSQFYNLMALSCIFRLTAFVAKTLFQAKFGEWEKDFFIPLELINKMVLWLCSQQHNVTGEFNELPGVPVYDRNFVSTLTNQDPQFTPMVVPLLVL